MEDENKKVVWTKNKIIRSVVWGIIYALSLAYVILVLVGGDLGLSWCNDILKANGIKGADGFVSWFVANYNVLLNALFFTLLILVLSKLLRILLIQISHKTGKKAKTILLLSNSFIKYLAIIILLFVVLYCLGVDSTTLLVGSGIVALVIGLGAQSLISDVLAGLFIVFEGDYQVGDIVVLDGFRGVVDSIGVRTTRLKDVGNNVKVINNSKIASIVNMTTESAIVVIDMPIDYDEDLERVEAILKKELPLLKEKYKKVVTGGPTYLGVQELADSSINLRILANCKEGDKFQLNRDLNRDLFLLFKKNNVNIPFNQVVVSSREESK
jgi:moderate conductance mechanosensitive channel